MAKESIQIIIESIKDIHTLKKELKSLSKINPMNWGKRSRFESLIKSVNESIDSLYNDNWDIEYLRFLEKNILLNYETLSPYMDEISLAGDGVIENGDITIFKTMYFTEDEKHRVYSLSISKLDSVSIIVFDFIKNSTYRTESVGAFSDTQKLMIDVLKEKVIKLFKRYLREELVNPSLIDRFNTYSGSNPLFGKK